MSNTLSYISAKKITSTKLDQDIYLGKFLCMADAVWLTREQINGNVSRACSQWDNKKVKPVWFIWRDQAENGNVIYKVPADFWGTFDEYQLQDFEEVGTLFKLGGKWTVLTNLKAIETMRRLQLYKKMREGRCSVGEFGYDDKAYRIHQENLDKLNGGLLCGGHGLDYT